MTLQEMIDDSGEDHDVIVPWAMRLQQRAQEARPELVIRLRDIDVVVTVFVQDEGAAENETPPLEQFPEETP